MATSFTMCWVLLLWHGMVSILELHFAVGDVGRTGMGFVSPLGKFSHNSCHYCRGAHSSHVPAVAATIPGYSHHRLDTAPRLPRSLFCCIFLMGPCVKGTRQLQPIFQGEHSLPGDIRAWTGRSSWMYIVCSTVLESKPWDQKCEAAAVHAFLRREFFPYWTAPHLCRPVLASSLLLSH